MRRGPYRAKSYLALLRIRAGFTQAEAARRIHRTREYLAAIEAGRMRPAIRTVARLAYLYNVRPREVLRLLWLTFYFTFRIDQ
jgi:transcriptional regulator with XRE-family HTH domain